MHQVCFLYMLNYPSSTCCPKEREWLHTCRKLRSPCKIENSSTIKTCITYNAIVDELSSLVGLLYADDTVLLTRDQVELQLMLDVVGKHAMKWRCMFNSKKNKTMMGGKCSGREWKI